MEYDVNLLAEKYLSYLAETEFNISSISMPSYNYFAYTDNEYTSLMRQLNTDFDKLDDLYLTEQFLTKNKENIW